MRQLIHMLCQCGGSIVPFATQVAVPCAIVSTILKWLEVHCHFHYLVDAFQIKVAAYGSFSSLLGFLVVFRTSQAYSRYWNGGGSMQQMMGSWFDTASSLIAFCKLSKADHEETRRFQHLLLRLFSLLTALALTELEADDEEGSEAFYLRLNRLEVIDVKGLDSKTLTAIRHCDHKMELVFYWLQVVIVEGIEKGVLAIAPPILSRAFMELADGMVMFQDCMKISLLPFPFPYSQATLALLICHWLMTPLMICTWTQSPSVCGIFSFIIVFIFWGLYAIAQELENPFGDDPNDLDAQEIQAQMNERLLLLVTGVASASKPELKSGQSLEDIDLHARQRRSSLGEVCEHTMKSRNAFSLRGKTGTGLDSEVGLLQDSDAA